MTLVYVSHSQPPAADPLSNIGGMQRVAEELLESLNAREDVDIHSILLRSSWKWIHVRILPFLFSSYFRIKSRIAHGNIDVILFSSMVSALLVIPLAGYLKQNGVRTAAIIHGLDITTPFSLYQGLVRRVFASIDLVLPVSRATAQECISRGCSQERVRVVHNGVKIARFKSEPPLKPERQPLLTQFEIPSDTLPNNAFLLCSVGRHVERKGYAWFIENVMPFLSTNVHYWLAGDGPETANILRVIKKMNLTERVHLLGTLGDPDLVALYRGCDLFVMPNIKVKNDMEGFGVVLLEAGMNGLPSVAARLEGIEEVIQDGKNGYFVQSGDSEGFATAISHYISASNNVESARETAYTYTRETFGWDTISGRVVEALSS